jgi:hypothetical protein
MLQFTEVKNAYSSSLFVGETGLVVKVSNGVVARIYISNCNITNKSFLYARLYDKSNAATSDEDILLCTFDSDAGSNLIFDLDNLAFTDGLFIRSTTVINDDKDTTTISSE